MKLSVNSAGYMHTARSRNDQVVTDFKLWVKESSMVLITDLNTLMKNIVAKAEKNVSTVMPGFTHLKNAQPVSFAHYLLAYYEMLKRDKQRFNNNLKLIDESPLGAAALSGTSYNINRNFTSKKLGFKNQLTIQLTLFRIEILQLIFFTLVQFVQCIYQDWLKILLY